MCTGLLHAAHTHVNAPLLFFRDAETRERAATANGEMKDEATEAGCDYFLVKPASKDDLALGFASTFARLGVQHLNPASAGARDR